MKLLTVQK